MMFPLSFYPNCFFKYFGNKHNSRSTLTLFYYPKMVLKSKKSMFPIFNKPTLKIEEIIRTANRQKRLLLSVKNREISVSNFQASSPSQHHISLCIRFLYAPGVFFCILTWRFSTPQNQLCLLLLHHHHHLRRGFSYS